MTNGSKILKPLLKEGLYDVMGGEDILIEAARDLVREEIKEHIREKLDANPELKKEFKDAIGMFFEAKLKEAFANIKLVKAGATVSGSTLKVSVTTVVLPQVSTAVQR